MRIVIIYMYICVCNGINESRVQEAIDAGITNVRDLREHLGTGNCCGRCNPAIRQMLKASDAQASPARPVLFRPSPSAA